jgi:hypothetical protein
MCDKPLASTFWAFDEVLPHWDRLMLRSYLVEDGKRTSYQDGAVAAMIDPRALMARHSADGRLAEGTLMFGGTLATHGGVRPTPEFAFEIEDPVLERRIAHVYRVRTLPLLG